MLAPEQTRRQRTVRPGGPLDRLIVPLKRLLPLLAVAALVAIAVTALAQRGEFSFILKRGEVATASERVRVERATYRGVDARGRPFSLRADEAVQRSAALPFVEMRGLEARLVADGGEAQVRAAAGEYDIDGDKLRLAGPVDARQGGYRLGTGRAVLDLKSQRLSSEGPVTGRSALGNFSGDRLDADVSGRIFVVTGRARLHIPRAAAK